MPVFSKNVGQSQSIVRNLGSSAIGGMTVATMIASSAYSQSCSSAGVGSACETESASNGSGFSISIDGINIAGDNSASANPVNSAKKREGALGAAGSKMKKAQHLSATIVDDLPSVLETPQVSVQLLGDTAERHLAVVMRRSGNRAHFQMQNNYPEWISRAEIRFIDTSAHFDPDGSYQSVALAEGSSSVTTAVPEGDHFAYVLRVYDQYGRFDQTRPAMLNDDAEKPLHAEEWTEPKNIKVHGQAVKIFAENIPQNSVVSVMGQPVHIGNNGAVETTRILPPGDHDVEVVVADTSGREEFFGERIYVSDSKWFYVGLADLTIGRNLRGNIVRGSEGEGYSSTYQKGRVAFYLKGKIKGEYLLTAAMDTGEDELGRLFDGLDTKDPDALLKRIDPESYYAVYGDQSTRIDDAPTSGKLYVRLDRGDSHIMWGDFRTSIKGTKLLTSSRALYGAQIAYKSPEKTESGSHHHYVVKAYAAQPDSLPQRERLRATGGSVYFLKRQDILPGTETIEVVLTDKFSGRIIDRKRLSPGADYELDAFQGVLFLKDPLSAESFTSGPVRDGAFDNHEVGLAVSYEYEPVSGEIDGYSYGGRGEAWLSENMRVGATAYQESGPEVDQRSYGMDVHYKLGTRSHVSAEFAQSEGAGFGYFNSTDGGLTNDEISTAGINGRVGTAWEVNGLIDLSETNPELEAEITFHIAEKSAGYSSINHDIAEDESEWGVRGRWKPTDELTLSAEHKTWRNASGREKIDSTFAAAYNINAQLSVESGVTLTDERDVANSIDGERVDAGVRITRFIDEKTRVWAFGQTTVSESGAIDRNDRYGVGTAMQIREDLSLEAEISDGTNGIGGKALLTYFPEEGREYYGGYVFDPNTDFDIGNRFGEHGAWVAGTRYRYSDTISVSLENRLDRGWQGYDSNTNYGVDWSPDKFWTIKLLTEFGQVSDRNASDFDRAAYSLTTAYTDPEGVSARIRGEYRDESSDDSTRSSETYALLGGLKVDLTDEWILKADAKALWSLSDQSSFADGRLIETRLGFAYRPTENDRINVLVNHRSVYDLPGEDQVNASGYSEGPAQRSHIFSVDGDYQLNKYVSLGAKYGYRLGEISSDRTNLEFVPSAAHLAIARADLRLNEDWSVLGEYRYMALPDIDQSKSGALLAVYRDINEHLKMGVGYNFTSFSDDLADFSENNDGVFLNVTAKF